ncbi:MAG: CAP domain-containing protein [Chloroflexota bacterium]|nr:CAP domain-containing protein [Chloroflexota bacterium]
MRKFVLLQVIFCLLLTGAFLAYHYAPAKASITGCINILASPNYLSTNQESDAIAALNNAHRYEHLPPLRLPADYYHLNPAQQQFLLLNQERTDRGLRPLAVDANLAQMALAYSRQLKQLPFFSHTSPIGGSFEERINQNPALNNHYSLAAENLAGNPVAGAGAIYEYMYNDSLEACGHRHNILNPRFTLVGINWVYGSVYGSISAMEFLASSPWNPYTSPAPDTLAPQVTIAVKHAGNTPLFSCKALAQDNVGVVRLTWFLDRFGNQPHLGPDWSLDTRNLSPGKHTLLLYAVDGEQNYSMASYSFVA